MRPRSGRRPASELARAGERAASLGANEEAERYFAQAAELADDPLGEGGARRSGPGAWPGSGRAASEARALPRAGARASSRPRGSTRQAARVSAVLGRDRLPRGPSARGGRAARGGARDARRARSPTRTSAAVAAQLGRFLVLDRQHDARRSAARARARAGRGARPAGGLRPGADEQVAPLHARATGSRRRASCSRARSSSRSTTTCTPPAFRAINNLAVELRVARPLRGRRRDLRPGPRARAQGRRPGLGGDLPPRPDQRARAARALGRGARARRSRTRGGASGLDRWLHAARR